MENFNEDELIGNSSTLINELETISSPPLDCSGLPSSSPSSTILSTRPSSPNLGSFSPTLQDLELNIQRINQYCDEVYARLEGLASPSIDNGSSQIDSTNYDYFTPPMNRRNDVVSNDNIDLNIPSIRTNEVVTVDGVVDLCSPARPNIPAPTSTVSVAAVNGSNGIGGEGRIDVPINPIDRRLRGANRSRRRRTAILLQRGLSNITELTNADSVTIPIMCPICMESAVNRQPTSTKCGHVFCNSCIVEAVRITRKCPLCNTKLSTRTLVRLYL